MTRNFVYFLFTALYLNLFGQCPEQTDMWFDSQASIDQFYIEFPNCNQLNSVMVTGSGIVNLNGLENLQEVTNDFKIQQAPNLLSLEGLSNLQNIGGFLSFIDTGIHSINEIFTNLISIGGKLDIRNNNLSAINDFNNLTSLGSLEISNNSNSSHISEISGFNSLSFIPNNLIIDDNVLTMNAFENLSSVGGFFSLTGNFLENITGFGNLSYIGGNTTIYTRTTNLQWLSTLSEIHGDFRIGWSQDVPNTEGFEELENLTVLQGALVISNAYQTNSLYGLHNIEYSGITHLNIFVNPELSECNLPNICQYLINGGSAVIYGNSSGCNSVGEILQNCNMGIDEIKSSTSFRISNNPVVDVFQIISLSNNDKIEDYSIYDLKGYKLKSGMYNSSIDVSNFPTGVYLINFKTAKGVSNLRFIKK